MDLYHFSEKEGESIKVDPEMKILCKTMFFKWKTLINDAGTGKRY